MNSRFVIAILIAGALAFACGPRTHSEASSPTSSALTAAQRTTTRAKERTRANDELTALVAVQVSGEDVRFALNVANNSRKRLEVEFPSGQSYDFVVLDSIGREVWRWANGRMFTQALRNRMLSGGDTLSFDERWEHPKRRGHFTVVATLRSSNFPMEERAQFVLP